MCCDPVIPPLGIFPTEICTRPPKIGVFKNVHSIHITPKISGIQACLSSMLWLEISHRTAVKFSWALVHPKTQWEALLSSSFMSSSPAGRLRATIPCWLLAGGFSQFFSHWPFHGASHNLTSDFHHNAMRKQKIKDRSQNLSVTQLLKWHPTVFVIFY